MITLLWVPYGSAGGWPVLAVLAMELVAFGIVADALHGRLAQDRPDPSHLTEFYLILSLGGALASALRRHRAPNVFPGVWESRSCSSGRWSPWRLDAATRRPDVRARARPRLQPVLRRLPAAGCCRTSSAAALLVVALVLTGALATEAGIRWLLVGGLILLVGARPWFLALATAFVLALATFVLQPPADSGTAASSASPRSSSRGRRPQPPDERHDRPRIPVDRPGKRRRPDLLRPERAGRRCLPLIARTTGRGTDVGVAGLGGGALAAYVEPAWR